jgi:hydrogenase expression/formation protein HypE
MKKEKILLAHGSGGRLTHNLIKEVILKSFSNPILKHLDDSAVLELKKKKVALSSDSYVVDPIFFPGGDIGKLAVYGTVNDLAMSGAVPLYLTSSLIIEEGFSLKDLKRIIGSMKEAAQKANVLIVAGDTKVVEKGSADKLFINTSGVGIIEEKVDISGSKAKPGDKIILSGTIGDHGLAILEQRKELKFRGNFESDCAPLNELVQEMLKVSKEVHALRDPTRGGLSATLNEIAEQSNVAIKILEEKVPIREEVRGACEMLGLDPLYIANEGKLVAFVAPRQANRILEVMRRNKYAKAASLIGEVRSQPPKTVSVRTLIGGTRILDMPLGEHLPRIC